MKIEDFDVMFYQGMKKVSHYLSKNIDIIQNNKINQF